MRLLAVSPHLDDAAFSAGGTLAYYAGTGARVTIATCFTGNIAQPAGFALACQLDKGLDASVDYMALRRAEDLAACAVIGAEAVHLPFLEAPHRGYDSAAALFEGVRADDDAGVALAPALAAVIAAAEPDVVVGPLAIGDHADHHVVRAALLAVRPDALLWEDWPYLDRPHVAKPPAPDVVVPLDDALRATRVAMCGAYGTQLGYQFGGRAPMAARIGGIAEERFHRP